MKKSAYVLLFIFTLVLVEGIWCGFNDAYNRSYAAEIEKDIPVNAKTEVVMEGIKEGVRVTDKEIKVELDDGTIITAQGEFEETIRLMVMPIKKSMKEEWSWLQNATKRIGINKSAYDIFFINSSGIRVDGGKGSQISVMSRDRLKVIHVYFIDSEGEQSKLKSKIEEYVVKFKMVRNGYYTLVIANEKKAELNKDDNKIEEVINNNNDNSDKNTDKLDTENDKSENKNESEKNDNNNEDDDILDKDNSDKDNSDNNKVKPDGSQNDENDNQGINYRFILMIVGIFLVTGIIFIIILFKRKKDDESNNQIE